MPEMEYRENGIFLKFTLDGAWNSASTRPVDTEMLEKAYYSDSYYENRDETPLRIDHDFAGALRNFAAPKPVPFENASVGQNEIMIWKF
jgi:hypothetical protein